MIPRLKKASLWVLSVILIALMVQASLAQKSNDWKAINGAVEAKKMWMALDAVTMGRDPATVIFSRVGSLPHCEIRRAGYAPVRRSHADIIEAFKLAVAQAYLR